MANYSTSAEVVLSVNGQQGQQMLSLLEREAKKLERQLDRAAKAGNKFETKRLQRDLNNVRKSMEQLKGTTTSVETTLRRLDTATPKELNRALKTLQKELNGIQRGTAAWDAQVAKIRMVKKELQSVNASMNAQASGLSKLNNWFNKVSVSIMAVGAALAGLVMAGRKAVQSYADMEEQMANTRKFTRMTSEEVAELNEAFKKMDTRVARDQLNLLAQEGGRLGYNTVKTVQEYVEAASIINVALVDLGEGATQTIAKLTNIFGVEETYGVRDAMLKVGSTVNHLSQNCTAAKPFIVEFAQRMAGIGSSAKMSIPELMAFAATLDAHGQKVEMSATALQRTIMELFKAPGEMARKVGLDAKQFTDTLMTSTTQGVMTFLEALHKLGEDKALAILAPLFQDLGLDGARVSSVLANLSSHLDFLKWQLGEANKAFKEGTSASNEYAIFNNTVQAAIDKARKRVSELAVQLGEKLYPIMKHVYTSSSLFLRMLNLLVTFFIKYKMEIAVTAVALASYHITLKRVAITQALMTAASKAQLAVHSALRIGTIALNAVTALLSGNLGMAATKMRVLNVAIKASPIGLLVSLITTAIGALAIWIGKNKQAADEERRLNEERKKNMDDFRKSITSVAEATSRYAEKEQQKLNSLYKVATNENASQKRRIAAVKELQSLYPQYFNSLTTEQFLAGQAADKYLELSRNIMKAARARAIADKIKENEQERLNLEMKNEDLADQLQQEGERFDAHDKKANQLRHSAGSWYDKGRRLRVEKKAAGESLEKMAELDEQRAENTDKIAAIDKANQRLRAKLPADYDESKPEYGGSLSNADGDFTPYKSQKQSDKEKKEADRAAARARKKEKEEFKKDVEAEKKEFNEFSAQFLKARNEGNISYEAFLEKQHELKLSFLEGMKKVYQDHGLTDDDDYAGFNKKIEEENQRWQTENLKLSLEFLNRQQKAEENQARMDAVTKNQSEETLQQNLFDIKIKYLKLQQELYAKSSKEYADLENSITEAQLAEDLRLLKRYAEFSKQWRLTPDMKILKQEMQEALGEVADHLADGDIDIEMAERINKAIREKYAKLASPVETEPSKTKKKEEAGKKRDRDVAQLEEAKKEGLITDEQYAQQKKAIEKAYNDAVAALSPSTDGGEWASRIKNLYTLWKDFFDKSADDGQNWASKIAGLANATFETITAGLGIYSQLADAEAEADIARTEKKYDREIELAQGNSYRVKQAEKKKEQEVAKIKAESTRRNFAIQVFQAIADTATNALKAYGSLVEIPIVGPALAAVAAATATAQGLAQVAILKKQKEAAEAQAGYAEGGFTPDGDRLKPVGVVHAGEWVASQRLVKNPATRPLIEALEYAQRNNTIGNISMEDVSKSITAPMIIADTNRQVVGTSSQPAVVVQQDAELVATIAMLKKRLDEPFVTINTVAGEYGSYKAQQEYNRLMKNKSPKSAKS